MFKEPKAAGMSTTAADTPRFVQRYIENFIDLVDNMPNDLSRNISRVHELQLNYDNALSKFENCLTKFTRHKTKQQLNVNSNSSNNSNNDPKLVKLLLTIQRYLTQMQELSDNKLAIIQEAVEQLDCKARELDHDYKLINAANSDGNDTDKNKKDKNNGATKSQSSSTTANQTTKSIRETSPEEPTYCTCHQVSYGDMICCDNPSCDIEWFHFQCVSLTSKPKGKWFCPSCRGDRSNQPKK